MRHSRRLCASARSAQAQLRANLAETLDLTKVRAERIPCVDLSWERPAVVRALRRACEYPGFFHLTGLPPELPPAAEGAMAAARAFFRLPREAKMRCANGPETQYRVHDAAGRLHLIPGSGNGYRPAGGDPYFPNDRRESYNVGREPLAPGEEPPYANAWPDEAACGLAPGWRAAVLAHQRQMVRLAERLRPLLALAAGAPANSLEGAGLFDRPTYQTGMVYYHAVRSAPAAGAFAIRPHQDSGLLTLLATDGEPGLHICPAGERLDAAHRRWVPVPHRPGALLVNLGTEAERWSNGRFRATLHCVVNETGRERFSLPFFYEPNLDAAVAPLPGTVPPGAAPRYEPTTPAQRMLDGHLGVTQVE